MLSQRQADGLQCRLKGTGATDADVHVLTQQRHVVTSSGQTSPGFTREPLYMHVALKSLCSLVPLGAQKTFQTADN